MSNYQVMPALAESDFEALKADIAERGVLIPVEYDDEGNILDGHHRVRACEELGISDWPRFVRKGLTEDEKRLHARQLNIARRHLSREQKRELIAGQLKDTPERSNRQVAASLGVDHKTVQAVRSEAEGIGEIPQCDRETKDGRTYPAARKPIRTAYVDPTPEGQKEAESVVKANRAAKAVERREERLEKIEEISKGNRDLDTSRKYPVIYADPPWRYEMPAMGGTNRSIENHYPTMTLEEICAMPVSELAADDAMLYMWATAPKLPECLEVVKAWGFEYRTHMVWDKQKIGMGYHARNQHEILLICKRGEIPPPQAGTQPSSIYSEPRGRHSAKPQFFYEMIEAAYPGLAKIELFCRSPRDGWSVWGNQSEEVA